ncbi:MAG: spore germination protein [Muribaculaceae bacterium]|nr:spore germination protein [Roseburia sp.]MCM1430648.1 spore germination protein [Muribaculaceae bacterium]MCM1491915.1 spore germination protein [Muribaculaceae bacterium]
MFSGNDKISMRQVYRLFVFDLIGVCTLELPAKLSYFSGSDGLLSIVIGGGLASVYLWYLGRIVAGMKTDLVTYVNQSIPGWLARLILLFLSFHAMLEAGFGAYIFADVMKKGLIPEQSYTLILILILLAAAYAVCGGIESRARLYEVLFVVLAVGLVLMFLTAFSDMEWAYVGPFFKSSPGNLTKGALLEVFCFIPLFAVVFFPAYVKKEKEKQLIPTVMAALWSAVLVLFVLYLLLLGSFGSGALMHMRYPAVTLMSNIHLRSSFLKRFDAFMLGIWFFTLFALVNLYLFYGTKLLTAAFLPEETKEEDADAPDGHSKRSWISLGCMMALAFLVAELFYYRDGEGLFLNYVCYLGMPLLVLLPGLALIVGKYRKKAAKGE